jgi:hypothetical protein
MICGDLDYGYLDEQDELICVNGPDCDQPACPEHSDFDDTTEMWNSLFQQERQ